MHPNHEAHAPSGPDGDTRIITLTTAAPVHIFDSEWPIAAEAIEVEAGSPGSVDERTVWLKVRRHADGRSIVYGGRIVEGTKIRGGEIVPRGEDPIAAVLRLAMLLDAPFALTFDLVTRRELEP